MHCQMFNPIKKIARFEAWCSFCMRAIKEGEQYISDGASNYCSSCSVSDCRNNGRSRTFNRYNYERKGDK